MRARSAVVIAAVLLILPGCGNDTSKGSGPTAARAAGADQNMSQSDAWRQDEGNRLRDYKRANGSGPDGRSLNAADFAYSSRPVDITAPGIYRLLFGPVDPWFKYPVDPEGFAISAPEDLTFQWTPGDSEVVTEEGKQYLAMNVVVAAGEFDGDYRGFVLWIY